MKVHPFRFALQNYKLIIVALKKNKSCPLINAFLAINKRRGVY